MVIGILDIQGSVEEHFSALKKCGVEPVLVKKPEDLRGLSGLIIPGGESTTISKLLRWYKFGNLKNLPIFGTCAGAILLAKMGLLNAEVDRNAYGRQLDSFETGISVPILGKKKVEAIFIRAPKFKKVGKNVEVLAEYKSDPVFVRQGRILASTFHPELTDDMRIHEYFIKMIDGG
ncbi:pyridoxal 5'-phosphate synthase glutaminase subunit PdxT [Patescibacteria group bacterium]|nr:pyridoxal 5'-phosphate synthase glutaminase subunit PdxT [Patescibacteria group bacterium]